MTVYSLCAAGAGPSGYHWLTDRLAGWPAAGVHAAITSRLDGYGRSKTMPSLATWSMAPSHHQALPLM